MVYKAARQKPSLFAGMLEMGRVGWGRANYGKTMASNF